MTAPRVLVVGDANLDLVLRGDVVPRFGQAEQLLDAADLVLGSSAGIAASGLARLGVETALCARVGADVFGRRTLELLADGGVSTAAVTVDPDAPTGVSVILSTPTDRAILTLTGAMAALDADDVRAAVAAFSPTHVHVAALFLVPALAPALAGLLAELQAAGITTSLDTNWDPAERWEGVADCLPYVDVLLPNAAEAVALAVASGAGTVPDAAVRPATEAARSDTGAAGPTDNDADATGAGPLSALDAARALATQGPIVAVKDGAAGGFAVAGDIVERAAGLAVDVVDTTGAGDSFDAAFLAGWLETGSVETALRWGATAGSLSTLGTGGAGGQPTSAELQAAVASSPS